MSAPLVSVFTPTHNTRYLLETYQSLKAQTFPDFEWVLVPNGGAQIPNEILEDPRVKVFPFPGTLTPGIGALKQYACRRCTGQLFVELDHDDLLIEKALDEIVKAWKETGADFLYSDFVNFYPDHSCNYWVNNGWVTYKAVWKGRSYDAVRAFPPTPHALAWIFYAPNHVRVWHRDIYERLRGHDPLRALCDDHDLLVRTYLDGGKMQHIPQPLYFYREHGENSETRNTYATNRPEILNLSREISNRNYHKLVYEWTRREGTKQLQLLAYGHPRPDHDVITIDKFSAEDNPFDAYQDNSVGVVWAYDFLPRVPQTRRVWIMNELYRILVPGGYLLSRLQSSDGAMADADPSVLSRWNKMSFQYYCNKSFAETLPNLRCRFQDTRVWDEYLSDWHRDNRMLFTYADLVALKGQRQPGHSNW